MSQLTDSRLPLTPTQSDILNNLAALADSPACEFIAKVGGVFSNLPVGACATASPTNGLEVIGLDIGLGGTLIQDTSIDGDGGTYVLQVNNLSSGGFLTNTGNEIYVTQTSAYIQSSDLYVLVNSTELQLGTPNIIGSTAVAGQPLVLQTLLTGESEFGSMDSIYASYDNTTSGLTATQVQAAIDELVVDIGALPTTNTFLASGTLNTGDDNLALTLSDATVVNVDVSALNVDVKLASGVLNSGDNNLALTLSDASVVNVDVTALNTETTTTITDTITGHKIADYTNEVAAVVAINETITTLVESPAGTFTYTSEDGTQEVITLTNGGTVQGTGATSLNIRATDEGTVAGNARGEYSVDLQTQRTLATQVASGNQSAVIGGGFNTASGRYSSVIGGQLNNASGSLSFVGGGLGNETGSSNSAVVGGNQNTASGIGSFIGGGFVVGITGNTASAQGSGIISGSRNTASGSLSFVGGGQNNQARSFGEGILGLNSLVIVPVSATAFNVADYAFRVGIGASQIAPADGFRVQKSGTLHAPNLKVYATNAAAITGGLIVGDIYRTSTGELRIVI